MYVSPGQVSLTVLAAPELHRTCFAGARVRSRCSRPRSWSRRWRRA